MSASLLAGSDGQQSQELMARLGRLSFGRCYAVGRQQKRYADSNSGHRANVISQWEIGEEDAFQLGYYELVTQNSVVCTRI